MYRNVYLLKQQAGKYYEKRIAHILRRAHWNVVETGRNGFNDHGIDIVASKDGVTRFIQCKGWRKSKYIHEDVISQLYGSVAARVGAENLGKVEMYIYSPAKLDDYAAQEAERLNIKFQRVPMRWLHKRYTY